MSDIINIQNKLEVKPGGILQVPGCEPISSLTDMALARNMHCNSSIIPVEDALRLIPGSKIIKVMTPMGQLSTSFYFVLPNGPPPFGNDCPSSCYPDWYAVLRANARSPESEEENLNGPCVGFNYTGCVTSQDPLRRAPDFG